MCLVLSRCDVLTIFQMVVIVWISELARLPVGRAFVAAVRALIVMPWKLVYLISITLHVAVSRPTVLSLLAACWARTFG